MRKVRFSAAVSLDGYIAGPNGEIDWIVMDPEIDFAELMKNYDTVLIGRSSYEAAREQGFGMMSGMQTYLFSTTLRQDDCPGVTVSDDPSAVVAELKASPGRDIWLFGGGVLFASLLDLGMVDEIEVAVIPVLLGGGVPLLPASASRISLTLLSHRLYERTGIMLLEYAPVRSR